MKQAPIGVFDSGIGGLTVLKELQTRLPGEDLIYFGDTARIPYGNRPHTEIMEFMNQIVSFLQTWEIKMAVVACNTMTTIALEQARQRFPQLLFVGVNSGIKRALAASAGGMAGVIATQATIDSGKHIQVAGLLDPQATVYAQPCPDFVPLIEHGHLQDAILRQAAERYMEPLQKAQVRSLVLGCTHYPLIGEVLTDLLGKEVALIDPAQDTVQDVCDLMQEHKLFANRKQGRTRCFFSADPERARKIVQAYFPRGLPLFEQAALTGPMQAIS